MGPSNARQSTQIKNEKQRVKSEVHETGMNGAIFSNSYSSLKREHSPNGVHYFLHLFELYLTRTHTCMSQMITAHTDALQWHHTEYTYRIIIRVVLRYIDTIYKRMCTSFETVAGIVAI